MAICLIVALGMSDLHSQPSPPRRPPEYGPATSEQPAVGDKGGEPQVGTCVARLAELGVQFRTEASPATDLACAIGVPVRVERLEFRHGVRGFIDFPSRPLIDCRLAEPLALWIGGVVAPVLAENFASALKAVKTGQGFECRNRNHQATGKISAHASGFALDISGFELANGRVVSFGLSGDPDSQSALHATRTAACGWFTTVLGPGSDAAHENHLHVDIQRHGSNDRYRICE